MIKPVSELDAGTVQQQPAVDLVNKDLEKLSKKEVLKAKLQAQHQEVKEKHQEQVKTAQAHAEKAGVTEKEDVRTQNKFTEATTPHAAATKETQGTQQTERVMPPTAVLHSIANDPNAPPNIPGPKVGTEVPNAEQSFKLGARLLGDVRDAQGNKLTAAQISQSIKREQVPRTQGGHLTPASNKSTTAEAGVKSQTPGPAPAMDKAAVANPKAAPKQAGPGTRPDANASTGKPVLVKTTTTASLGNPVALARAQAPAANNALVTKLNSPLLEEATQKLNFDYGGTVNFTNFNNLVTFLTITLVEIELEFKLKRKKLTHEWEKIALLTSKMDIEKQGFDRRMERAMAVMDFCNQIINMFKGSENNEKELPKEDLSNPAQKNARLKQDIQSLPPALVALAGIKKLRNKMTGANQQHAAHARANPPNNTQSIEQRLKSMGEHELGQMAGLYHSNVTDNQRDTANAMSTFGQQIKDTLMQFNNRAIESSAVNRVNSEANETRYSAAQNALISLLMSQRSQLAQRQHRA